MGSPGDSDSGTRRSGLVVRPAVISDVHKVAAALRQADRNEIQAGMAVPPLRALGLGYAESRPCLTIAEAEDDNPIAMFGVVPSKECETPRCGLIWLLGTDGINRHKTQFLRESAARLADVCKGYDVVGNVIDARNGLHIIWLRWLGFKLLKRHQHYGPEGREFIEFFKVIE